MNSGPEVSVEYLRTHFEPEDLLAVVMIQRPHGGVQQEIKTAKKVVESMAHYRAANAHNKCIYVTANTLKPGATGRTKADIEEVRNVFLDIDTNGNQVVGSILASPEMPKPHDIIETSRGRYQLIWKVDGFTTERAEQLVREMSAKHGADRAVWDAARVLRLPGFRNCKFPDPGQPKAPHYVSVTDGGGDPDYYRPSDFPKYDLVPEPVVMFGSRAQPERGGDDVDQSKEDFAFACRQLRAGVDLETIAQRIDEHRRHVGGKRKAPGYGRTTVMNARQQLHARPMGITQGRRDPPLMPSL